MKALITRTALAAAIVSLTATAMPAAAKDDGGQVRTATVRYADLDLSTDKGIDTFRARYSAAAREVCGMDRRETGTSMATREARECYVQKRAEMEREVAVMVRTHQRQG